MRGHETSQERQYPDKRNEFQLTSNKLQHWNNDNHHEEGKWSSREIMDWQNMSDLRPFMNPHLGLGEKLMRGFSLLVQVHSFHWSLYSRDWSKWRSSSISIVWTQTLSRELNIEVNWDGCKGALLKDDVSVSHSASSPPRRQCSCWDEMLWILKYYVKEHLRILSLSDWAVSHHHEKANNGGWGNLSEFWMESQKIPPYLMYSVLLSVQILHRIKSRMLTCEAEFPPTLGSSTMIVCV